MTGPVPRTTSPRRTVRVAVALVAGQAVLCAVIGWVTFGPSPGATSAGRVTDTQAGPAVMPTASTFQPAAPLPPPAKTPPTTGRAPVRSPVLSLPKAQAAPPARPTSPRRKSSPAADPGETPTTTGTPADATGPPPAPPDETPTDTVGTPDPPPPTSAPVVIGEKCGDEGERGRTEDGRTVRCAAGADGGLIWQIV